MNKLKMIAIALSLCCLMQTNGTAQIAARGQVVRANPSGGVTAVSGAGVRAAGGVAARASVTTTNGQGTATRTSAAGFRGFNGQSGKRTSQTTTSRNGAISRQSAASASGARGSVNTKGSYIHNPDGTATATRNTTATNATNGDSYQGSTSFTKGEGIHSTRPPAKMHPAM